MKNKEIVRQLRKKAKQHKGITFLSIENGMYENKNKDGYDNREEEEMEPVQAKPHLFGLGAGSRY